MLNSALASSSRHFDSGLPLAFGREIVGPHSPGFSLNFRKSSLICASQRSANFLRDSIDMAVLLLGNRLDRGAFDRHTTDLDRLTEVAATLPENPSWAR